MSEASEGSWRGNVLDIRSGRQVQVEMIDELNTYGMIMKQSEILLSVNVSGWELYLWPDIM